MIYTSIKFTEVDTSVPGLDDKKVTALVVRYMKACEDIGKKNNSRIDPINVANVHMFGSLCLREKSRKTGF